MAVSVMHSKGDSTCWLCMRLNGDYGTRTGLQEHHAVPGTAGRRLSEKYGLKVYLCLQHHTAGPEAVHNNQGNMRMVQEAAQRTFEAARSHGEWMQVFGRNYL